MKLHRVTIENLGSLYGTHELDLERDLGGAPLFVIVGPTGAGKSTVLDAVSLALFGETPRLTSDRARNRGDDHDVRHIMSRGAGECRAVLELSRRDLDEGSGRARFRATWYCHRAGTRPDGALQPPRRGLERWSDALGAWEVLVDDQRRKFFEGPFDEALGGLTVDDFQRSMLLPQGQFAALLEAPPDAKAAILERLTNTAIYLDVGQRANQRRIAAQRELDQLTARLEGVTRLAPEEAAALEQTLAASRSRLEQARRHARTLEVEAAWLAQAEALTAEEEEATSAAEAARLALEDAAPELGRLAEDSRCRPAQAGLDGLRAAERQEAAARAKVRGLAEEHAHAATQREVAQRVVEAARDKVRAARIAIEEATPRLQLARRAEEEERRARGLWERAGARRDEARERLGGLCAAAEDDRARLDRAELKLAATAREAAALGDGAALGEALSGLEARWSRLAADTARREELDRARRRLAAEGLAVERARAEAVAAADEAAARMTLAAAACGWRGALDDVEAMEARLEALATLAAARERGRAVAEREAREASGREALLGALAAGRAARAALAAERTEATARRKELIARHEELSLALSLIAYRSGLEAGEACPLCGALDHPYERDPDVSSGDVALRSRAEKLAAEAAALGEQLEALGRRDAALEAELLRDEALAERCARALEGLVEERAEVEATIAATPEPPPEGALPAARAALGGLLAAARAAPRAHEKALLAASEATRLAEALAERERELAALGEVVAAARAGLTDALATHGIAVAGGDAGLGAAITAAGARVARWRAVTAALALAEREAAAAREGLGRSGTLQEAASEQLVALEAEAARASAALEGAAAASRALLGGERADDVASRLDAELVGSRERVERAERALAVMARDAENLAGQLTQATAALHEAEARREAAGAELERALTALGIPDVASLEARILDDATRRGLVTQEATLRAARTRAADRLEQLERERAQHAAERPASLAAGATAGQWQERLVLARRELDEANQTLGAVQQKVAEQDQNERRYREARRTWEQQRATHALWSRLHRLIGGREGRAFQEFAQILSLGELIDRANHRLQTLAPRYRLVHALDREGRPRLDFAIRDQDLAGKERPITTLSGGETFLVSLALALGLSDLRTAAMPIETLLLDEGFGTLDPESLDQALACLEELHGGGRIQVGIISHVDAMRERISARVHVERLGNGRSRLRAERAEWAPPPAPASA